MTMPGACAWMLVPSVAVQFAPGTITLPEGGTTAAARFSSAQADRSSTNRETWTTCMLRHE